MSHVEKKVYFICWHSGGVNTFWCFRYAIKLLEDVVFFVADVVNSGQPVLDVVMTKPNRERQKLMREQNILKQV